MYITESEVNQALKYHWKKYTVVAPNERVTVIPAQLTIDVFCCLFESNVHVSIDGLEFSCQVKKVQRSRSAYV